MNRFSLARGMVVLLLAPFLTPSLSAQDQELRDEIEALKEGQQAIQKQLEEIKKLLQTRGAARPAGPNVRDVVFDLGDNPTKGSDTAKLTLVEFTDYQ